MELELREMRTEFRRPRDALLGLVSEYFSTCLSRYEVHQKQLEELRITPAYFLDSKSHEVRPLTLLLYSLSQLSSDVLTADCYILIIYL